VLTFIGQGIMFMTDQTTIITLLEIWKEIDRNVNLIVTQCSNVEYQTSGLLFTAAAASFVFRGRGLNLPPQKLISIHSTHH